MLFFVQAVIQDPKKISLIMQVFKHNNTRTENVALEKLSCWWHFLWLLGDKVSPNFEQVYFSEILSFVQNIDVILIIKLLSNHLTKCYLSSDEIQVAY